MNWLATIDWAAAVKAKLPKGWDAEHPHGCWLGESIKPTWDEAGSFNGRTSGFGPDNGGSIPPPATSTKQNPRVSGAGREEGNVELSEARSTGATAKVVQYTTPAARSV